MNEAMHEPLSWLTLERYALDELTSEERIRVAARLVESSEDRACLESILQDTSELPALPLAGLSVRAPQRGPARAQRRTVLWACGALAMAAALALVIVRPDALPPSRRQVSDGLKGGEVALIVHGERSGRAASSFAQGERFKLLLTCPSWLSTQLGVVIFQAGQRYQPLSPVPAFACGNLVPWPGAFSLDGSEPAEVCVSFGGARERERARSAHELEPAVVCTRLLPAR